MLVAAIVLLASLTFGYICALLWLAQGLRAAQQLPSDEHERHGQSSPALPPTVTVIVCARNEETHLPQLLADLSRQDYPAERLQLYLVDDRSSDGTGALMTAFAAQHPNARHLRMHDTRPDFAPKKRALDHAIRQARGEIILLTDADARAGPTWVSEMAAQFRPGVVMVCGYSPYFPRTTLLQNILALEYFSLAAVAAASIGAGRPLTCTGSNFAYRRAAYLAIDGFAGIAHFISGDDDLLLHKMHDHHAGRIAYAGHPAIQTAVRPPASWQEFQSQRTRYASKGRHYRPGVTLGLAAVYLLNLLLVAGLLSVLLGTTAVFAATLICGSLKAGSEFLFLRRAAVWFKEESLLQYFLPAALLHPFYVVYFATRAPFAKFTWRGQSFATTTAGQQPAPARSQ